MDLYRISVAGGQPERLTHHNNNVTHPVLIDPRTFRRSTVRSGWVGHFCVIEISVRWRSASTGYALKSHYPSHLQSGDGCKPALLFGLQPRARRLGPTQF